MLPRNHLRRIRTAFDDHRLVNNAGLILPATLAQQLGLPQLVERHIDLVLQRRIASTGHLAPVHNDLSTHLTALRHCLPRSDFRPKTDQIEEASL